MKLPVLSAHKVIRILEKEGFQILRQKGSHISLYKKIEKKTLLVVVPDQKRNQNRNPHRDFKASEPYKRRISRFVEKIKEFIHSPHTPW